VLGCATTCSWHIYRYPWLIHYAYEHSSLLLIYVPCSVTDVLTVQGSQWRGSLELLQYNNQFEWDTQQKQQGIYNYMHRQTGEPQTNWVDVQCSNLTVPYTTTYYIMQFRSKNKEPASTLRGMPSETCTRDLDHKVQFCSHHCLHTPLCCIDSNVCWWPQTLYYIMFNI